MKTNTHFLIISPSGFPTTKNVSDKSCRENEETHFVLFSNHFFPNIVPFMK